MEITIRFFKFVWKILPIQPTIQPRAWHTVIKNACRNIYATQKNSTKLDRVYYTVSIYVEKTRPGNFLPYAFLMTMGHPKRLLTYDQTDSRCIQDHTRLRARTKFSTLKVSSKSKSGLWCRMHGSVIRHRRFHTHRIDFIGLDLEKHPPMENADKIVKWSGTFTAKLKLQ
jgi:hypothetical protein